MIQEITDEVMGGQLAWVFNLENLRELHEKNKKVLIEANGLRNHLVHRYNRMDDLLAFESMKALLPGIQAFCAEVESWIEKRF